MREALSVAKEEQDDGRGDGDLARGDGALFLQRMGGVGAAVGQVVGHVAGGGDEREGHHAQPEGLGHAERVLAHRVGEGRLRAVEEGEEGSGQEEEVLDPLAGPQTAQELEGAVGVEGFAALVVGPIGAFPEGAGGAFARLCGTVVNAAGLVLAILWHKRMSPLVVMVGCGGRGGAQLSLMLMRNSALEPVRRMRLSTTSMASLGPTGVSTLRMAQMRESSSGWRSKSSLRVPDCSMLMAG